jgi:S-methylmethionine-dependent homocysteine/selenocysteine methylase
VDEVRALVTMLAGCRQQTSGWISMACRSGTELNSGESIEDALRCIEDPDPYSQGWGCSDANDEPLPSDLHLTRSESDPMGGVDNLSPRRLAVGVNCTSPRFVPEILDAIRDATGRSMVVVAYPNRGEQWDASAGGWAHATGLSDEEFADQAVDWFDRGARVIGGCCRTTCATIGAVRKKIECHRRTRPKA